MLLPTSLLVLSLLAGSPAPARAASPDVWTEYASGDINLHYLKDISWRGLDEGRVKGADVAGHAAALPGVHDFLRLVPPTPLAHGSLFSPSPMTAKEWIVEIAFRVHGPPTTGVADKIEMDKDGKITKRETGAMKGGRGLAFWVTKEGLPGPVTIAGSRGKVNSPPPISPTPLDLTDSQVSLFGSRASFDGLGIVFDSSPSSPLLARSSSRNLPDHHHPAVGAVAATGVVSGIMDDGSGGWLDKETRVIKGEEEAGYLERAVGECEAAFRNAQGLLWARVAHVNGTIRLDLDLSPHTTLSKAGRHYEHNCFTLPGVTLTPNNYLGISGLASGSTEPDAVDVYAMDVFEILPPSDTGRVVDTEEPPEPESGTEEVLEGTTDDEIPTLTHELFVSQARIVEAIDALARRVESLGGLMERVSKGVAARPAQQAASASGSAVAGVSEQRLASLDSQLADLVTMMSTLRTEDAARMRDGENLAHVLQLQERLMEEIKSVGRRVEGSTGQHSASLSTLSSRSSELLSLSKSTLSYLETQLSQSFLSGAIGKLLYTLVGVAVGVMVAAWREKRKRDGGELGWGGGRKHF
ncbi:hypothetical protein JCM11641_000405 [Rhodosporidiobolus odoratus]